MGVNTQRPSATASINGSYCTVVGAANAHTALSDGSTAGSHDSTYVQMIAFVSDSSKGVVLDLPSFTIPSGARISGVRVRQRSKDVGGAGGMAVAQPWVLNAAGTSYTAGVGVSSVRYVTIFNLYEGGYETLTPYGLEWVVADLTALRVLLTDKWGATVQTSEIWVDALYYEKPVTTVTDPAEAASVGTPFPSVGFTFSQADSVGLDAARVKIFNAAQYGAGGFSPETSTPYVDSGWVATSNPGVWATTTTLPNDSYRGYAKTRIAFNGGYFESDWDYNSWTVSVTPPPTPTLAAAASATDSRTTLTITSGGGSPSTDGYDAQYSDDATTWLDVRNSPIVGSGTQVLQDYEAPPNTLRSYRARAYRVASGTRIVSAWSNVPTATMTSTRWRLVDPFTGTGMWITSQGDAFTHQSEEQAQAFYPLGRKNPIVLSGTIQGENYPLSFPFGTEAEFLAFEALRNTQHVLLLKSARNWQKYIKFVGTRAVTESRVTADATPWWYQVSQPAVEQDRP